MKTKEALNQDGTENYKDKAEVTIPNQEWFTYKLASQLKGLDMKTGYNNRELMPNHGIYEGEIGGRKVFRRETIVKWLKQKDEDIKTTI